MRPLDIFDTAEPEAVTLRECDQCVGTVREDEPGQFRQCVECGERVCAEHSHGERADLCRRCGEEADERTCQQCGKENVETRVFSFGGRSEPSYEERLGSCCVPWPRWQKALQQDELEATW